MKKLALNKETIRQLGDEALVKVQGGGISDGPKCDLSKSCLTRMGCRTEIIC